MVGAGRTNHTDVCWAAHASHVGPEPFGNLHGKGADATRRTVNQDPLPRFYLARVAKPMESSQRRCRYGRRLLKREVGRLERELVLARACILSAGAPAFAEHFIARAELRDLVSHRFHHARGV